MESGSLWITRKGGDLVGAFDVSPEEQRICFRKQLCCSLSYFQYPFWFSFLRLDLRCEWLFRILFL